MDQTTHKEQKPETRSPIAAGEANERRTRYETGLGVVGGGTMGLLLTIGFKILPAYTFVEKMLIITASLALGLASWMGLGAWRSIRRFTVVAIAAAAAIVCLCALSIVANNAGNEQGQPSAKVSGAPVHGSANPSGNATPRASPDASPSSSPQAGAPTGPRVYLADMSGDPASTTPPQTGTWGMLDHSYTHSIGYPGDCSTETVNYSLAGRYQRFQATVGLNDDADPEDQGTASSDGADFTVFANTGGGSMRSVSTGQAFWGHPITVSVSVAGATLLQLQTGSCFDSSSSVVVWGNASLLP